MPKFFDSLLHRLGLIRYVPVDREVLVRYEVKVPVEVVRTVEVKVPVEVVKIVEVERVVEKFTPTEPAEVVVMDRPDGARCAADDVAVFKRVAQDALWLVKLLGDRQNADLPLSARAVTQIVTVCLNAGNLLGEAAQRAENETRAAEEAPAC